MMSPDEKTVPTADVLKKEIVYDGEGYTRGSIENMLQEYQGKHALDLKKFGDLSKAYDRLSKEMTQDISETLSPEGPIQATSVPLPCVSLSIFSVS